MRSALKIFFLAAVTTAVLAFGVLANSNPNPAAKQESTTEVKIDNFSFTPQVLTVRAGTSVTWTNHDDIPHNVVSSDQKFKSKAIDTDESFSHTFAEPGTYEYFCSIHPKMTAKVIVEEAK
jgi:plastocyanin